MSCPNHPGDDKKTDIGVCHLCAMRDRVPVIFKIFLGTEGRNHQTVYFCSLCCHWMCDHCWDKVMGRFAGFMEKYVKDPVAGCCGPQKESEAGDGA